MFFQNIGYVQERVRQVSSVARGIRDLSHVR